MKACEECRRMQECKELRVIECKVPARCVKSARVSTVHGCKQCKSVKSARVSRVKSARVTRVQECESVSSARVPTAQDFYKCTLIFIAFQRFQAIKVGQKS